MSRKGFLNGIVTGSIIGAVAAMIFSPQLKPTPQKVMDKGRKVKARAQRTVNDALRRGMKEVKDMMD